MPFLAEILTTACAVGTPSATSPKCSKIVARSAPFASILPTLKLRESSLEAERKRSPAPLSPKKLSIFAPKACPKRAISTSPRAIKLALALLPSPMPSQIPPAIAITFLYAPQISVPMTSLLS